MDPMSTTHALTEAQLLALSGEGKRELVDGEVRVSPAGAPHGWFISRLLYFVMHHVMAEDLGFVFEASTGFWMPTGNLRSPDLAFVAKARLQGGVPDGFLSVVPDLIAEVASPGDQRREILDKVGEYLDAGVRMAWVIDPATRTATRWRALTRVTEIPAHGDLDGEDVLSGFRCPLASVFG